MTASLQLDMFPTDAHLRCINPERNKWRFYRMSIQPTLFDDWLLVREWGRIGQNDQARHEHHASIGAALTSLQKMTLQKRKRGYQDIIR